MHLPPAEQQILLFLQTAALVGLAVRMWLAGLPHIYVYFFSYLILALLQSVVLTAVGYSDADSTALQSSVAYGYAWMASEGVIVCSYALVVLECYANVLRNLAGIASLSRRYVKITLSLSILIALLLLGLEKTPTTIFGYFYSFQRAVVSSLIAFVLLITAFLAYYPVPLNRNVIVYSLGYAVYFLTKAAALFVRNLGHRWDRPLGDLLIIVSTGCLVFWIFALNRQGETKTAVIGHKWHTGDEERLLLQLMAINAGLSRAVRK
jgi:hypothetical protein